MVGTKFHERGRHRRRPPIPALCLAAVLFLAPLLIGPALHQASAVAQSIDEFEALDSIRIPLPGQSPEDAPTVDAPSTATPTPPPPTPPSSTEPRPAPAPALPERPADPPAAEPPRALPDLRIEGLDQGGDAVATPPPGVLVPNGGGIDDPLPGERDDSALAPVGEEGPAARGPRVDSALVPVKGIEPVRADLRLVGEAPRTRFRVFAAAIPSNPQLQFHYHNGVDMLPDASELLVHVNGDFVGSFRPNASLRPRTVAFDVPADLLVVGANEVEIRGRQRHRVACGPDAAFDLWTSFDPNASGPIGAEVAGSNGTAGATASGRPNGDLAMLGVAIARTLAEGRPIAVTFEQSGDTNAIRAAIAAAEEIGAMLGGRVPDYEVRRETFAAPGEAADNVRIRLFPAERNGVRVVRGGDGAVVLAVDYTDAGVVDSVRSLFANTGMSALQIPVRGQPVPLAAFDVTDVLVNERYRRLDVAFQLPEDWFVENDVLAELALDYAFIRGLPEQSQLIISANGTSVRLLPLDRNGGEVVEAFPVRFPARLFSPGVNALTMEVRIPGRPETSACPDVHATDIPPMVGLFRTSTLTIPEGSPFRSIPNLAPMTTLANGGGQSPVFVDVGAGRDNRLGRTMTVSGAWSSSLGQGAGLQVAESTSWSDESEPGIRLRVIRPAELTEADLASYGLTLQDVLPRLAAGQGPMESAFSAATGAPLSEVSPMESLRRVGLLPDTAGPVSGDAADAGDAARAFWERPAQPGGGAVAVDDTGVLDRVMMTVSSLPNRLWRFAGALGWVPSSDPVLLMRSLEAPAPGMLLDRIVDGDRSILVVADGPGELRRLTSVMATGNPGGGPRGSFAVASSDGWWVNYRGGARVIEQTGPVPPSQLMPAAGTLASAFPVGFIVIVVLVLSVAAFLTSRIFLRLGDPGDSS